MIGAIVLETLLFAEGVDYAPRSLMPVLIQRFRVAGNAQVIVCKTNGVAQRIDLPFTFVYASVHVGYIRGPDAHFPGCIECVGIRIQEDSVRLSVNEPTKKQLESFILWRKT